MLLKSTIARVDPDEDPGRSHPELYERGLEYVRALASRVWTDHNVHDPGITTLELLCYALTDLTYRAESPIEDLLMDAGGASGLRGHFFSARTILPMRPLTALDYRKLLIDIPGIKNAWLVPVEISYYADIAAAELRASDPGRPGIREVEIRGVYRPVVAYGDEVATDAQRTAIKQQVKRVLHDNRCLCEDFADPADISEEKFRLCGEFELAAGADVAAVKAEALTRIARHLSPSVPRYTLSEMLAKQKADGTAYTAPDVFDGPALKNGFIADDELEDAGRLTEIRLSDVISELMDIDGVEAVRDVVIAPAGGSGVVENRWIVAVDANKAPVLDIDNCRLVFYKRGLPVTPADADVQAALDELAAEATTVSSATDDVEIPVGRYRDPGGYYSLQNHFPLTYGLSQDGVVGATSERREILAKQLKGYLLFFDQLLANYCAQLARVRDLFSMDEKLERTYYAQVVDSFKDYDAIYRDETTAATIAALLEDRDARDARRERFLNHLIARFAERFHDFAAIMYSAFGATAEDLERARCRFLNRYPAIGAERALGYNYTKSAPADRWNSLNISGLERRVAALLDVVNPRRRNLGAIPLGPNVEISGSATDKFRFRILRDPSTPPGAGAPPSTPAPRQVLLRSSLKYDTADKARAGARTALARAELLSGYELKTGSDGRYSFSIKDQAGTVVAERDDSFADEDSRASAIDSLIAHVRERYSVEGMYVIENILLRPESAGPPPDPFLPICVDPNCADCSDDDPYSYRIHVILPAYAGRFQDMDFRRFVEDVIRDETPAHVLPKICWADEESMAKFERAYSEWIDIKSGASADDRAGTLRKVTRALYEIKNVYPTQTLADCAEGNEPFVLGRNALGTDETTE